MNEHAIKCLESIIEGIRKGKFNPASETKRAELINLTAAYMKTVTATTDMPLDHIMWLSNTLYTVYCIGKLDGWREALQDAKELP